MTPSLALELSANDAPDAPAVSVVVSTRNHARYLGDTLDAIEAQSLHDLELVLVDNASSDETQTVVRDFLDRTTRPVTYLRFTADHGPAVGRSAALERVRGEFVAFTDSDCVPSAGWLDAAVRAFAARDEAVGIVQGRTECYEPTSPMFSHFIETRRFDSSFSTSNVVYRRAALDGHEFDRRCSYWEDTDLGFRVRADGWRVAFADDALVYHQVVPQTVLEWLLWPRRYANWPAKAARYPEFRRTLFLRVWVDPDARRVRPRARRRARHRARPETGRPRAPCSLRREFRPDPGPARTRARGQGGLARAAGRRRVLRARRRQRSSSIGGALMDMKMFKLALRHAWPAALLLMLAALFGSYVYVQKRIPPTAKASVSVRDPLTINPSQYTAAQVAFDAIVKSDRLAENVQKAMGPGTPSVAGKLSVEVMIPSNGINISPLYVVRAQDSDPKRALTMVKTAVDEARKLYIQLNQVGSSQLASVDRQRVQASNDLAHATVALNAFNAAHGGDVGTQLSTVRAEFASVSDHLAQAKADLATVQRVTGGAGLSAANARVAAYLTQLNDTRAQLMLLAALEPQYQNLASELSTARTSVQQFDTLHASLAANAAQPINDQIKALDDATMDSKALMKILVYLLGFIVGLLAAMGAIYLEANRLRSREGTEHVITALCAPTLGRIPRRAVVEVK